jgi:hypothetical protein
LLEIAPPERQAALREQLELLKSSAREAFSEERDRAYASRSDRTGIG